MAGLSRLERLGTLLLFAATIVVALSILLDGASAKVTNGMAGLLWFAAAAVLARATWRADRRGPVWLGAIALTAVVAFVAKPTDFVMAVLGFGVAGTLIALLAGIRHVQWATLIVACYLPMHIGTAILKAVLRDVRGESASIRTDPPPTAAVVPLAMLLAAMAGAWLVANVRSGRRQSPPTLAARR